MQILAGGDAEVFARQRDLLATLGDPGRIIHVGGYGAGYTAKLLINLLWFGQAVATAEALLLGQAAGLDLGIVREALTRSAADSRFIRHAYRRAVQRYGPADGELLGIALLEEQAGRTLRHPPVREN